MMVASNSQHKRFIETAREIGADESNASFDRALKKIVKAPPPDSVLERKSPPNKPKAKKPAK